MSRRIDPMTRYVAAEKGCWLWTGPLDARGYARHGASLAHRIFYERLVGLVPDGRGIAGQVNGARQRTLKFCKRNRHELTPDNTGTDHRGDRFCRECVRQGRRLKYATNLERNRKYAREKQRERRAALHG